MTVKITKKTIKTTRVLCASDLRAVCIKHGWYTAGTNREYETLMRSVSDNTYGTPVHITDEMLYQIAVNIKAHSETEHEIHQIMFVLNEASTITYEII